mmetsp:Transcript_55133/g.112786  ORF Transcript_55133/g.112786 Transcript_55133/m.112786 type:complete len:538 (+) Transcript_55133:220-1833(+)|eukprot:CAMPEP_0181334364 /NCGR_PEP_ID=MMETSP1101-20121128/26211_1 /TAXON_ID=46948 /ORGANISM="Rhodomonas abbreviata, Strain Caron Lab Isolate" /LENGTH=537 /DNA_ID=CAMNT_0023444317 /DNA_START=220 /DNA_END=1833 /DNA_ORIENTATION=-
MKHGQVNLPAVVASIATATLLMVAMVVIADSYTGTVELKQAGTSHGSALEREIQLLRSKLDLPTAPVHHAVQRPVKTKTQNLEEDPAEEAAETDEDSGIDITKPLLPETANARAVGSWARQNENDWYPEQQRRYDRAVAHAQVVEKGSTEVFQPLRLEKGYLHKAEDEENQFEEQIISLMRILEPSYISEAARWAESGDTQETSVLEPFVEAIERPLVKDLELEAEVRVNKAVDSIAAKEALSLPEKEELRAHLMAPLMVRIRSRVHAHVAHYVNSMARQLVLKAANSSELPGMQDHIAAARGAAAVPDLTDDDMKMIHALHDLNEVHKDGVIDEKDYETQRAKLLSDWLKHSVNKAGGNANEVLRIEFGGEVRGVTTSGIKDKTPIDVQKKIEMEKGIAYMQQDRTARMNKDLVAQLVKGKTQWGLVADCNGKWDTPECAQKWKEIEGLVEAYAGVEEDGKAPSLADEVNAHSAISKGTKRLFHHIGSAPDKIWEVAKGHAHKAKVAKLKAVTSTSRKAPAATAPEQKHWYCLYMC